MDGTDNTVDNAVVAEKILAKAFARTMRGACFTHVAHCTVILAWFEVSRMQFNMETQKVNQSVSLSVR